MSPAEKLQAAFDEFLAGVVELGRVAARDLIADAFASAQEPTPSSPTARRPLPPSPARARSQGSASPRARKAKKKPQRRSKAARASQRPRRAGRPRAATSAPARAPATAVAASSATAAARAEVAAEQPGRVCSVCGEPGHNARRHKRPEQAPAAAPKPDRRDLIAARAAAARHEAPPADDGPLFDPGELE